MPDQPTSSPEPGAVLVRFDDGSGIVFGDGSPEEADALRALLREQGCSEEAVAVISQALLDNGFTMRAEVPEDARAFSGDAFQSLAAYIARDN